LSGPTFEDFDLCSNLADTVPLALILSEPLTNSTPNLGNSLLPYRLLPTLRKTALHTDQSPAARAASPGHWQGRRCKLCHFQRRRSLDSKESRALPLVQSIPRQFCSQVPRLRKRHNRKLRW